MFSAEEATQLCLIDSIQNHAHYSNAILNGANFTISNHTALECSDKENTNWVVLLNISPRKVYGWYIPISGKQQVIFRRE